MKAIDTAVDANMKARENQKRIAVIDAEGNPRIVRGLKANGTALGIKTKVLFPDTPWIRHQFEIWKRALAEFKKAETELTPFIIPARRYPRRAVDPLQRARSCLCLLDWKPKSLTRPLRH
jgi:hypothetical protein